MASSKPPPPPPFLPHSFWWSLFVLIAENVLFLSSIGVIALANQTDPGGVPDAWPWNPKKRPEGEEEETKKKKKKKKKKTDQDRKADTLRRRKKNAKAKTRVFIKGNNLNWREPWCELAAGIGAKEATISSHVPPVVQATFATGTSPTERIIARTRTAVSSNLRRTSAGSGIRLGFTTTSGGCVGWGGGGRDRDREIEREIEREREREREIPLHHLFAHDQLHPSLSTPPPTPTQVLPHPPLRLRPCRHLPLLGLGKLLGGGAALWVEAGVDRLGRRCGVPIGDPRRPVCARALFPSLLSHPCRRHGVGLDQVQRRGSAPRRLARQGLQSLSELVGMVEAEGGRLSFRLPRAETHATHLNSTQRRAKKLGPSVLLWFLPTTIGMFRDANGRKIDGTRIENGGNKGAIDHE